LEFLNFSVWLAAQPEHVKGRKDKDKRPEETPAKSWGLEGP